MNKNRFFFVSCFQEHWDQRGHPTMAMNYIGRPAKFLYNFQCTFTEENKALGVIVEEKLLFISEHRFSLKEIFIVHEIHLQARVWQRSHLDQQRMIFFI